DGRGRRPEHVRVLGQAPEERPHFCGACQSLRRGAAAAAEGRDETGGHGDEHDERRTREEYLRRRASAPCLRPRSGLDCLTPAPALLAAHSGSPARTSDARTSTKAV